MSAIKLKQFIRMNSNWWTRRTVRSTRNANASKVQFICIQTSARNSLHRHRQTHTRRGPRQLLCDNSGCSMRHCDCIIIVTREREREREGQITWWNWNAKCICARHMHAACSVSVVVGFSLLGFHILNGIWMFCSHNNFNYIIVILSFPPPKSTEHQSTIHWYARHSITNSLECVQHTHTLSWHHRLWQTNLGFSASYWRWRNISTSFKPKNAWQMGWSCARAGSRAPWVAIAVVGLSTLELRTMPFMWRSWRQFNVVVDMSLNTSHTICTKEIVHAFHANAHTISFRICFRCFRGSASTPVPRLCGVYKWIMQYMRTYKHCAPS